MQAAALNVRYTKVVPFHQIPGDAGEEGALSLLWRISLQHWPLSAVAT
jgi:hypothetical protein